MTNEEVAELLGPFEAESIRRGDEHARVYLSDVPYVEQGELRERFTNWWDAYDEKHKSKREPFDLDTYLISLGLDSAEKQCISIPMTYHYANGPTAHEMRKHRLMPNGRLKPATDDE